MKLNYIFVVDQSNRISQPWAKSLLRDFDRVATLYVFQMNLHLNWRLNGNEQNFKIRNTIRKISHYSDSLMYHLNKSQHISVTEKKSMPISTLLTDYYTKWNIGWEYYEITIIIKSGKAKAIFLLFCCQNRQIVWWSLQLATRTKNLTG